MVPLYLIILIRTIHLYGEPVRIALMRTTNVMNEMTARQFGGALHPTMSMKLKLPDSPTCFTRISSMNITRFALLLIAATAYASLPTGSRAQELSGGGWRGTWHDENKDHTGPLRGWFKPTHDGNYRVVFTGKYAKVVPFVFATKLRVVGRDGDQVILGGSSRLPLFGRFTYNGIADGNNFEAQYNSRRWKGSFRLMR